LIRSIWLIFLVLGLQACATGSRLYPDPAAPDEAGALRLVQLTEFATRAQILSLGEHYERLLASGISDEELVDGSLAIGRVYCCGGPNEGGTAPWVFLPPTVRAAPGDIVEVRMGRPPAAGRRGEINTVLRIRQKAGENGPCRWIPENPRLWVRYLYCPWMEQEGWQERRGTYPAWLKHVAPRGE
jgi:hypothetical protein